MYVWLKFWTISKEKRQDYVDSDFIGKNYQEVVRKLKRSGFKYIMEEPVKDLSINDIKKDNFGIRCKNRLERFF